MAGGGTDVWTLVTKGEPLFIEVCQLLTGVPGKKARSLCRRFSQKWIADIGSVRISSAHPRRHQEKSKPLHPTPSGNAARPTKRGLTASGDQL